DWSSDVCSSDLIASCGSGYLNRHGLHVPAGLRRLSTSKSPSSNSGQFWQFRRAHLLIRPTASDYIAIFFEHLCRSCDRWLFRGDSMEKHFLTSSVLFLAMGIASAQVTGGGAGSTGAPGTSSSGTTTGTTSTGTQTTPNGTSSTTPGTAQNPNLPNSTMGTTTGTTTTGTTTTSPGISQGTPSITGNPGTVVTS